MPKSSLYAYKYTPKGANAQKIVDWMSTQNNKAESLNLLILQAINRYGDRDIVAMTTQAFLDGQINPQTQPVQTQPTMTPKNDPEPSNTVNVQERTTQPSHPAPAPIQESEYTPESTPSESSKKPNLGLLRH